MIQFKIIENEGIFVSLHNLENNLKKEILIKVKDIAFDCIRKFASDKNWKTIGNNIHFLLSDNQVSIIPSDDKLKLFSWLHSGTRSHPVPLGGMMPPGKALSWVQDGKRFFSKGHIVKGITPTHFFQITSEMKDKINNLLTAYNE
jgi:hypothetical protein